MGEWNQGRMDLRRTETWVNGIKGKRDLGQTNIHSSGGLDSTSVLLHHYFCCLCEVVINELISHHPISVFDEQMKTEIIFLCRSTKAVDEPNSIIK